MGYDMTLEGDIYLDSDLPWEEIEKLFKSWENGKLPSEWKIEPLQDHGREYRVWPEDDDYCGRFHTYGIIENFLSTIIAPDCYCKIEWTGEDGVRWGSLIFHTDRLDAKLTGKWNIYTISYIPVVAGLAMVEFVKNYLDIIETGGDPQCLKKEYGEHDLSS